MWKRTAVLAAPNIGCGKISGFRKRGRDQGSPVVDAAIFCTQGRHRDRVTCRGASTRQRAIGKKSRQGICKKKVDAGMVADCNVPSYHLIRVIGKLSTVPCLSGIISNQSLDARSRAFVIFEVQQEDREQTYALSSAILALTFSSFSALVSLLDLYFLDSAFHSSLVFLGASLASFL